MQSTVSALALFTVLSTFAHGAPAPLDNGPLHKLELRKIPNVRDGEHPHMAFQRHQNAAVKRLHRFTGREVPDEEFFMKRTLERRLAIGDLEPREEPALEERLWFPPPPANDARTQPAKREAANIVRHPSVIPRASYSDLLEQLGINVDDSGQGVGFGGSAGIIPTASSGGNDASGTNAAAAITTTITSSGSNKNGFSQAEYQALVKGTITDSTSALIKGGLPYDIEFNDVGYMADVQIGTPLKTFTFLMDSGSGDTWVPSTQCGQACGNHQALGSEVSSSFQSNNQQWGTQYGSGSVSGVICQDDMSIAGMLLQGKSFGVALSESSQFGAPSVPFDGLMGLSMDQLSNQRVITPIEALAQTGQVQKATMGYALGRVADGFNDGEIVFGQADPAKFDASTTQTISVSATNGFWQIPMGAVTVNGQTATSNKQVIIDTGTSLMIAPQADAAAFHAAIPGSQSLGNGMFSIPCTTEAKIFFQFGDADFQLDPRDLLFQPTTNDLSGQCVSALSAGTVTNDQTWLLGDSFLKNVYFTTNVDDKTVQLSARTDVPGSSSYGVTNSAASIQALEAESKIGAGARKRSVGSSGALGLGVAGGLAAYFARLV